MVFIELLKNDGTAKRIRYNINDLEKELEPCDFVRIHPLELVNCDYVFRIKNGKLCLITEQNLRLPILTGKISWKNSVKYSRSFSQQQNIK